MDLLQRNTPNYNLNRSVVLKNWLWVHKTGNISEMAQDRAKVNINGLYKFVHELSNSAKMYDLA